MNGKPYPVLDLFSGYGGFALAFGAVAHAGEPSENTQPAELWTWDSPAGESSGAFRTIGFSEIEPYACALLAERFPHVPNFGDVATVTRDAVLARCGTLPVVVTGGFPCQPHSTAGKRGASADERDLWHECVRVLRDLRPRFALFENVPGLLSSESGLFFNRVLSDLADVGYACAWQVVSAADLGAPHLRERVWMLCWDEQWEGLADSVSQRGCGGHHEREDAGDAVAPGAPDLRVWPALAGDGDDLADRENARAPRRQRIAGNPAGGGSSGSGREGDGGDARSIDEPRLWPAAHGLWPARPGEAQYEWEPPRVVGGTGARNQGVAEAADGADSEGEPTAPGNNRGILEADELPSRPGCGTEGVVAHASGQHGSGGSARTGRRNGGALDADTGTSGGVQGRQAEPELGGGADGPAPGMDAAPAEVHEAPDDTVNRTHRLKALGNGIVPACAVPFALAIRDCLEGTDAR